MNLSKSHWEEREKTTNVLWRITQTIILKFDCLNVAVFFPKFHPLISRCSKSHTLFFRLMFELQFFLCIQNSILSSFDLFIVNFSARHFYWNFYCDIIRFLFNLTVCISITSFIRCKNESFWSSLFIGSLMSMRSSCCASASLIMSKLLKMLYKKLFCISLSSIIFV